MDSDVTYADLKFPTKNQTAGKETDKTKISRGQNKLSTKIMIASVSVICFLLISALIALLILYSQALSKFSLSEKQMEELQNHYNESLEYIGCKNRTSGKHCGQYFESTCPTGWIHNNSRCYYFAQETKSWDNSRSACRILQADLVIIDNGMEQAFIRSTKPGGFSWIGLTDLDKETEWKWVNGATLESKEFWNCRQPDDSMGNEDCATVGSVEECGAMKDWNDDTCGKALQYICEKGAEDKKKDFILPATK